MSFDMFRAHGLNQRFPMKVLIPSTYVGLIEHRKSAHDALGKLGLHVN